MANKLDLSIKNDKVRKVKIGELKQEVIDSLGLNLRACDIMLWSDRLKYTEKHISDFKSEADYYKHIEQIPDIIENPDFIGLHPSNNSIQYIKRINEIMLVGIRIKTKGNLNFRSTYPISQEKLNAYIKSDTIIAYDKIRK